MSPTAEAVIAASTTRDAAMKAAYDAEGTDREAWADEQYAEADAAYREALAAHRAARIANGDRDVA